MKVDKLYMDISPKISERIAVFPGDKEFKRTVHMSVDKGDHIGLSSIESTVHLGSHADAPSHYGAQAMAINDVDLNAYMGKAQVIELNLKANERVQLRHIQNIELKATRILFKTNSFNNPEKWNSEFNSLSSEVIEYLSAKSVILVGIDTPSVDPAEDRELESHQALKRTDTRVLEGLYLKDIEPDCYQLIALPLAIEGADASPVRAILLPLDVDLSQH